MAEGSWLLSASTTGTTVRVRHDAPEDVPPTEHDQRFWIAELRMTAAYGLSDSFAMDLQVPYRLTATTVKFRPLGGGSLPADHESIHHRNETLHGFGDPRIGGRTGWTVFGAALSLRAGISAPLGSTEPDPFALGDAGKKHQHIQFGTGTFDPFADLGVTRTIGPIAWSLRGSATVPFEENEHGYQAGARYSGAIQASFPESRLPSLRIDLAHEEPERWQGEVLREGNLGRTDLLVGASLAVPLGAQQLSFDVAVPVWQRIEGSQVEYPAVIGLGLSRAFGAD